MKDEFTVEDLARNCSDFGEHVEKISAAVRENHTVIYDNEYLDSTQLLLSMIDDDSDLVNKGLSSLCFNCYPNLKFLEFREEKLKEMAEEAARSYQEKYDV